MYLQNSIRKIRFPRHSISSKRFNDITKLKTACLRNASRSRRSACKRSCLKLPSEILQERAPGKSDIFPQKSPSTPLSRFHHLELHTFSGIACGRTVSTYYLRRRSMQAKNLHNAVDIVGCRLKAVGLLFFVVEAHSLNYVTYFSKY